MTSVSQRLVVSSLLSFLFLQAVHADSLGKYEQIAPAFMASVSKLRILIDDQVKDSCLPQPNQLKDKMEISLRKNGLSVVEDYTSDARVDITAFGYKTDGSCVVHLETSVTFFTYAQIPNSKYVKENTSAFISYNIQFQASLLTGPDMQYRLVQAVERHADSLSLEVLRAREVKYEYR
ncbi:hypothetical protein PsAD13_04974 [Pseudovibrio sp. Ad13]|uniref:hypothetical protein n=1 Tax=Pseudovibrio sp. Ad13 TaxID=989396 RepID=UPI0007B243F0|nr:hypothetical protein [Pseudovibrio sp. Ad13]KZK79983.1 hypothetical protein PsAD13_04974 [Pseudovibrio sp. Ad13]